MVREVAVHGLFLILIRPPVLGVQVRLLAIDVVVADVVGGEAAQLRMQRNGIEPVATVGEHQARRAGLGRMHRSGPRRIFAVFHPAGENFAQFVQSAGQRFLVEKAVDYRVPVLPVVSGVRPGDLRHVESILSVEPVGSLQAP